MTNKELIAVLQTLPPDAKVTVSVPYWMHDGDDHWDEMERSKDVRGASKLSDKCIDIEYE